MPKNKLIYFGMLVVAAAALLWAGGKVINYIEWFLPWAGGVGIVLILIGILLEMKKKNEVAAQGQPDQP
ncbi:MAG TPA: hypothetical protein VM328_07190 [Fimbriimonadaceae bacterium]|nr:hypothetical protein [Fimbriimonadaceae bacterium]